MATLFALYKHWTLNTEHRWCTKKLNALQNRRGKKGWVIYRILWIFAYILFIQSSTEQFFFLSLPLSNYILRFFSIDVICFCHTLVSMNKKEFLKNKEHQKMFEEGQFKQYKHQFVDTKKCAA